jgi:PKD repeat protein
MITSSLRLLAALGLILSFSLTTNAQNQQEIIQQFLNDKKDELGLKSSDIQDWIIYDNSQSKQSGATYVYIRQRHQGIEVFNGVANFAIKDAKVLHMGNRLEANLASRANTTTAAINPMQAVEKAATQLNLTISEPLKALEPVSSQEFVFSKGGISLENITAKLVYQPGPEGELRLAWNINIYEKGAQHWWDLRLDATTGQILEKDDWVVKCQFPENAFGNCNNPLHHHTAAPTYAPAPTTTNANTAIPEQYRVFAYPVESPNHGSRTLQLNPYDSLASPYGWHDIDGVTGAEYTITRGNNVHAYEDRDDDNNPGYSPDGTAALNFDFPLNLNQAPTGYEDAAITNLFYWNNLVHDMWYHYGFDESFGNFQENNYGRGGAGSDYVFAEAQDGGGTNNANFATPTDGSNPRMQMYLWTGGGGSSNLLTVNAPSGIAGQYSATEASFGPGVPATPITADLVLVDDATTPDINDGCETITNTAALNGKIAVLYRGNCNFTVKVENAQIAGAVAVIVINNVAGAPITMGGTNANITIPSIMLSDVDGAALVNAMGSGTVNATIVNNTGNFDKDGDFDNGIIAHEYGHGISIRLTGGGNNSSCLGNAEQMGEGWSDFFGLMMTIEPGDAATDIRGIGTFAVGQPTNGGGIRNAPYTTNTAVNPYTYADVNDAANVSQPHGVGFVWCTMLWDLNWALINQYGFDSDLYNGTGGNNICMQLVIEGCKLQACNPGFVDGRDAILAADQLLYGGANQCLIWQVFANRGLGASADQGSSNSRSDQIEAFDIPSSCQTPTSAPSAGFNQALVSSCQSTVVFTDQSTDIPQSWDWDFGDGNSSTNQNPTHSYAASGSYTVTLIVSNSIGADTLTQTVNISLPPLPSVSNTSICSGQTATLNGTASGTIIWYDATGTTALDTTTSFVTPSLTANTDYMAENVIFFPSQYVGVDSAGAQGNGGYHNTGFTGTQNFEAFKAFTLVSAWIDAGSAGPRDIIVWDGADGTGNIVDQVTINVPAGPQRLTLNLEIPGPGNYSIGNASIDLFRNNNNVSYPYVIPGILSVNSSSATTDPLGFWYYVYDWEVQEAPCRSPMTAVTVSVSGANFSSTANNLSVDFTDLSTGASSWAWDFGDGNTSTQQNPTHVYASAGTYTVTLTVDGNTSCPFTQTITVGPTSVTTFGDDMEVSMMPNPANAATTINFSQALKEQVQLQLVAVDGRILQDRIIEVGSNLIELDLQDLPSGMYLVRLNAASGAQTLKLTKKD